MLTVLLVIQVIIAALLVIVILLQRSGGNGLAGFSGSSSPDSILSSRASASAMTKVTAFLAVVFMVNSLAMAAITARQQGLVDRLANEKENENTVTPSVELETETVPSVPIAE